MEIESNEMKRLILAIMNIHPDEITCGECFDIVDQYVEMELEGKKAAEALPMVEDHLNRCGPCKDEYQALFTALKMMADKDNKGD